MTITGTGGSGATADVVFVAATGTAAINFGAGSGSLTLAAGVTLTLKGSVTWSATGTSGSNNDAILMQPGSHIVVDESGASAGTIYTIGPSASSSYRRLNTMACTLALRCSITATGGVAAFTSHGLIGFGVHSEYTDFSNLGDALTSGVYSKPNYGAATVSVEYSTFTNCGSISFNGGDGTATIVYNYNVHTGSLGKYALQMQVTTAANEGVSRQLTHNLFDAKVYFLPRSIVIDDNYFGGAFETVSASPWASFNRNFVRVNDETIGTLLFSGGATDLYYYYDTNHFNPHWIQAPDADGIVYSRYLGQVYKHNGDSGEMLGATRTSTLRWTTMQNSIALPADDGLGHSELTTAATTSSQYFGAQLLHNTWIGKNSTWGAAAINETGTLGGRLELRSNIVYGVPGHPVIKIDNAGTSTIAVDACNPNSLCDYNSGYNFVTTQATGCTDCANQGWGYAGKWTNPAGQCTPAQGPGCHDLDGGNGAGVDPRFADIQRNVLLWDNKYLGNSYTAWSDAGTYAVGDLVTLSNSGVYWSLPLNFRAIKAHSSALGTKPGAYEWSVANGGLVSLVIASKVVTLNFSSSHNLSVGDVIDVTIPMLSTIWVNGTHKITAVPSSTSVTWTAQAGADGTYTDSAIAASGWRNYWEFTSLYRLRQAISAGTTYTDGAIQCAACAPTKALINWVMRGYTPQEPKLRGAGHDGADVGAVPLDPPKVFPSVIL
ncbi:MAG: hypothetical protein M1541_03295 [Acidobacteria bacterium]|nr:hypothetical protein [Acidobacteriota bacterium]